MTSCINPRSLPPWFPPDIEVIEMRGSYEYGYGRFLFRYRDHYMNRVWQQEVDTETFQRIKHDPRYGEHFFRDLIYRARREMESDRGYDYRAAMSFDPMIPTRAPELKKKIEPKKDNKKLLLLLGSLL